MRQPSGAVLTGSFAERNEKKKADTAKLTAPISEIDIADLPSADNGKMIGFVDDFPCGLRQRTQMQALLPQEIMTAARTPDSVLG